MSEIILYFPKYSDLTVQTAMTPRSGIVCDGLSIVEFETPGWTEVLGALESHGLSSFTSSDERLSHRDTSMNS